MRHIATKPSPAPTAQLLSRTSFVLLAAALAPVAWGSTFFVTESFLPPDRPLFGAVLRALPVGVVLLLAVRKLPQGHWWWRTAVGFVLVKRWAPAVGMVTLTAWQLVGGGLMLVPVAIAVEGAPPEIDTSGVLGYSYLSVIGTGLAFLVWFRAANHLPAGSVALIGLLNPVTGTVLGVLFAGEAFGSSRAAGVALIVVGVLLGQVDRRNRNARRRDSVRDPAWSAAGAPAARPGRAVVDELVA